MKLRGRRVWVASAVGCLLAPATAWAQSTATPDQTAQPAADTTLPAPEIWAFHGQATFSDQYHPAFYSALRGPYSLDPGSRGNESFDVTLYAGLRPWAGGEIWADPEIDQGFGLSNTVGAAGFFSAEALKVGSSSPYIRLPQLFFRQTLDLGGETEKVDPDLTTLGGSQTANRFVFWLGKFAVTDVFDTNAYANSARSDFLNWSIVNAGSFDYAANAWGFTYGTAMEWYQGRTALRFGAFDLSTIPNGQNLDTSFGQFQLVGEAEERHTLWGRAGKLRVTAFLTRGRMGNLDAAVDLARATGQPANVALVRVYRSRAGISLNLEQQLTDSLGVFARAGYSEGGYEFYEYTDINKTLSAGLSLQGVAWGRPDDTVGLAGVTNDASRRFKNYLGAGGLGIETGDGALPLSGPERFLEAYYRYAVTSWAQISGDYQFADNPAYDRLRGPVSIFGVRLHVQY